MTALESSAERPEGLANELAKRVVKDGQRIKRGAALEIASTFVATAVCVWLVARSHGELVTTVICAGVLVYTGVWVTRLLTLREGSLQTAGTRLDAFVELTRRRLTDDLRWIAFGRRATQIIAALVVPWFVWMLVSRYERVRAEPWRAVVGFGSAALILAALFIWQRYKRRKLEVERERFEAVVADRTLT